MLNKLTITVLDPETLSVKLPRRIEVQYNPTEITLQKGAQIAEQNIPGLDSPLLQFVRGQTEKLSLELIIDQGSADDDDYLEKQVQALYQLVKIQSKTHAVPRVLVTWSDLKFKGVAESVQRKFTLFDPEGKPRRAVVTISFREYRTLDEQLAELNLQSPDRTKVRIINAADRLDSIAHHEYGDVELWRELGAFNEIENPRQLEPGFELRVPPLDELRFTPGGVA